MYWITSLSLITNSLAVMITHKAIGRQDKILSTSFSEFQGISVVEEIVERPKLYVVDHKSLSISKCNRVVFSFQKRKLIDECFSSITSFATICCRRLANVRLTHGRYLSSTRNARSGLVC